MKRKLTMFKETVSYYSCALLSDRQRPLMGRSLTGCATSACPALPPTRICGHQRSGLAVHA